MSRYISKNGDKGMLLYSVEDCPFGMRPIRKWYVMRRTTGKITPHYGDYQSALKHYNTLHKKCK